MDWVFLSKLVPLFLYPLNLVLLALGLAGLFYWFGKKSATIVSLLLASAILVISSLPVTAAALIRNLESKFTPVAAAEMSRADAIVILGGVLALPQHPRVDLELVDSSDRIRYAWQLYRQGKANKIIIAGGNVFPQQDVRGEAYYIAKLLTEWGVPQQDIIFEEQSRNTYENAVNIKPLLEENNLSSVLLVTSATHMPRALAVFKAQNIEVIPAPTDIQITESDYPAVFNWIPNAQALAATTWVLKEYMGWWYYRMREYI